MLWQDHFLVTLLWSTTECIWPFAQLCELRPAFASIRGYSPSSLTGRSWWQRGLTSGSSCSPMRSFSTPTIWKECEPLSRYYFEEDSNFSVNIICRADRKSQVRQYLGFCSAESQANEDQKSAVLKPKHFLTLDFQSALIIWQNFSDWESGEGHEHGDTEQSLSLHCLWLAHHYQWFLAEPSGKLWHYSVVIVLLSCKNYLPSYRTTVTIYQLPLELNHGMAHAPTIPAHWPRCSWTRARPGDKYRASSCLCQVCGRV